MTDDLEPVMEDVSNEAESAPPGELSTTGLEALLFVAERPLSRREIAGLAGVGRATVDARLGDLEIELASRGVRVVVDGNRVMLATSPDAGALVARYVGADPTRLTPAALETLAIVAYKQPVTRHQVSAIRGVNSDGVLRALADRGLVTEVGREDGPGRPMLYGTTPEFLERLGLASLSSMPPLAPLLGVAEDEPETAGE